MKHFHFTQQTCQVGVGPAMQLPASKTLHLEFNAPDYSSALRFAQAVKRRHGELSSAIMGCVYTECLTEVTAAGEHDFKAEYASVANEAAFHFYLGVLPNWIFR